MSQSLSRIVQLSDIHVWEPSGLHPFDLIGKRGAGFANYRLRRRGEYSIAVLRAAIAKAVETKPDMVVVSGDLSNLGLRSELEQARRELQPVVEAGLRLAIIPGNHDAYLKSSLAGQFEEVLRDGQQADDREASPYPFLMRLPTADLLCMSSAIATVPLMAYGRIGEAQFARAEAIVGRRDRSRPLALTVHHPVTPTPGKRNEYHRELRDAAELRDFATRHGAVLVAHGHNHLSHVVRLAGGCVVSGISSSTTRRDDHDHRRGEIVQYHLGGDGLVRLERSRWNEASAAFSDWAAVDLSSLQAG
jgi:3',5'-cyclic AMP phosphodiesterase CpdA